MIVLFPSDLLPPQQKLCSRACHGVALSERRTVVLSGTGRAGAGVARNKKATLSQGVVFARFTLARVTEEWQNSFSATFDVILSKSGKFKILVVAIRGL